MKKLKFEYRTEVDFSGNVIDHGFLLRCIPKEDERQHLEFYSLDIWPKTDTVIDRDFWGNNRIQGAITAPHNDFGFCVKGEITVDLSRPRKGCHPIFRYPTEFTKTSPAMEQFCENALAGMEDENELSKALKLMNLIYSTFIYESNVTNPETKAEEAFELGKGVCQDYAHILEALCLYAHIPARYTAGFMLGEGYTHAWTEIFSEGCWYGLDPTNNLMVDETYIKLAHGRDARDCSVLRGGFKGCVMQNQNIYVHVEESL